MMRVGVFGAGGRMGREVCRAVRRRSRSRAGGGRRPRPGRDRPAPGHRRRTGPACRWRATSTTWSGRAPRWRSTSPWPTRPSSTCAWCAVARRPRRGGHDRDRRRRRSTSCGACSRRPAANCVVAANFAIGAVLMMRFAELAAPFMDGVEIIELHHDGKLDAPSGTALRTARAPRRRPGGGAAAGRWPGRPDGVEVVGRGARGRGPGRDPHPLGAPPRPGGPPGGALRRRRARASTIRHDAYDRTSFMPGVILAVKAVAGPPRAHRRARHRSSDSEPAALAWARWTGRASASSRPPTPAWPAGACPRRPSRTRPARPGCPGPRCTGTSPAAATSSSTPWCRGSSSSSSAASTRRSTAPTSLEEVLDRGLVFAHRSLARARGAPEDARDRARRAHAQAHRGVQPDRRAHRRLPRALPARARHGRGRRDPPRRPTSWPG